MIGELVANGLPTKIQKACDIVRISGNEGIHNGEIRTDDSREIAEKLFTIVNLIVDHMITQEAAIDSLYRGIPEAKQQAIVKRDT